MQTETRYFRANVRPAGAIGAFASRDFALTVPVTGSHHALMDAAIVEINREGFEVAAITSHSINRDCL